MPFIAGMTTNRSFAQIDEQFALRLSDAIREKVSQKVGKLTVIDIACGPEGRAISELAGQYRGRIYGIGVDFHMPEPQEWNTLSLLQGDLFSLPQKLYGISDVTYCANILSKLAWDYEGYGEKLAHAISEISRTLAPGGVAFIDEGIFSADYEDIPTNLGGLRLIMERVHEGYSRYFSIEKDRELPRFGNHLLIKNKL